MYVFFTVKIEGRMHQIRVAVPESYNDRDLKGVVRFAFLTALLEHRGFLPSGVTHAVA